MTLLPSLAMLSINELYDLLKDAKKRKDFEYEKEILNELNKR